MAITDIISKQVTVLKADASQFKAEMRSAGAVEQKVMKERLEGLEKQTVALERSGQRFGLWAAAGVTAFGLISTSVKKYEEHLVSLGSKGEAELKRLKDTTGSLSKAQDALQISLMKVLMAATPVVEQFTSMATMLGNIATGIGAIVDYAVSLPVPGGDGGDGKGGGLSFRDVAGKASWLLPHRQLVGGANWLADYIQPDYTYGGVGALSQRDLLESLQRAGGVYVGAQGYSAANSGIPYEQTLEYRLLQERNLRESTARMHVNNLVGRGQGFVRGIGRSLGIGTERRGGGGGFELGATVIDEGAVLDYNMDTPYLIWERDRALNQRLARGSRDIGSYADLAGRQSGDLDKYMNELRIEESMKGAKELMAAAQQRESLLESIFGPVEEFELYQTAWQGLESVVTAGFNAWIDGSKSVGEAMKEALHGFAKQLAGEALLQALRHGAYALGSLAFGDVRGASQHGIAAAKWGAVALTAGVIGKATAPSQGAGAGSGAYAAAGIGGGIRPAGNSGGTHNTIIIGDSLGYESPRSQAQRVRRGLDLAEERTRNSRSVAYA